MNLTQIQKISIAFFIASLLPAYIVAEWRNQTNLASITEKLEQQQALHNSLDKLLSHCEDNESKTQARYDANHQICTQGEEEHDRTAHAVVALKQEIENLPSRKYKNLLLAIACFNLLGFVAYKGRQLLQLEATQ